VITFELTDRESITLLEVLAGVQAAERISISKDAEANRRVYVKLRNVITGQLCRNQEAADFRVGRDIGRYIESGGKRGEETPVDDSVADVVDTVKAKIEALARQGVSEDEIALDEHKMREEIAAIRAKHLKNEK